VTSPETGPAVLPQGHEVFCWIFCEMADVLLLNSHTQQCYNLGLLCKEINHFNYLPEVTSNAKVPSASGFNTQDKGRM